jgi:DNA-binding MarR family transcriptional regulator
VESSRTEREAKIEETLGLMRGAMGRALAGIADFSDKEGLPILQHFALHYIMFDRTMTQSELANLLGVSPGYVTTLVDRLEAERLVKRIRDRKDRRRINLRVTLAGHHFHHQLHRKFGQSAIPLFNGWTDEEITTFQILLRKLAMPPGAAEEITPALGGRHVPDGTVK